MITFDYKLVTDRFTAEGQVDAEDEKKAESFLRRQTAQPRGLPNGVNVNFEPPKIKSIKLTPKKSV